MKTTYYKSAIRNHLPKLLLAALVAACWMVPPPPMQAADEAGIIPNPSKVEIVTDHMVPPTVLALPATKWEYAAVAVNRANAGTPQELVAILNRMGDAGWDLITVNSEVGMAIFKRPR